MTYALDLPAKEKVIGKLSTRDNQFSNINSTQFSNNQSTVSFNEKQKTFLSLNEESTNLKLNA